MKVRHEQKIQADIEELIEALDDGTTERGWNAVIGIIVSMVCMIIVTWIVIVAVRDANEMRAILFGTSLGSLFNSWWCGTGFLRGAKALKQLRVLRDTCYAMDVFTVRRKLSEIQHRVRKLV